MISLRCCRNSGIGDIMCLKLILENLKGSIEREPGMSGIMAVSNSVILKSVPADLSTSDTEIFVVASFNEQILAKLLLATNFGCLINSTLLVKLLDVILYKVQ